MASVIHRPSTKLTRTEILRLFKTARSLHKQSEIEIKAAPKKEEQPKLLIVLPRAVGNAVTRNTIKRRLKAIIAKNDAALTVDIVIFVKKGADLLSFATLHDIITQALS